MTEMTVFDLENGAERMRTSKKKQFVNAQRKAAEEKRSAESKARKVKRKKKARQRRLPRRSSAVSWKEGRQNSAREEEGGQKKEQTNYQATKAKAATRMGGEESNPGRVARRT